MNLVTDEQDIVFFAELLALHQVTVIGDKDSGFTLNGLDQETGNFLAVLFQVGLEILGVVVAYEAAFPFGTKTGNETGRL